jgi:hypothetical protein
MAISRRGRRKKKINTDKITGSLTKFGLETFFSKNTEKLLLLNGKITG